MNEYDVLLEKGMTPKVAIDPNCPVITPYELLLNKRRNNHYHGSCNRGMLEVMKREQANYHLRFRDLFYPRIFNDRIFQVDQFYSRNGLGQVVPSPRDMEQFRSACNELTSLENVIPDGKAYLANYRRVVLEGSQGLMLDQDIGIFPYVTPSNTGTKNALEMIGDVLPRVWMVTRAYQTRHGDGPMGVMVDSDIRPNQYEINVDNENQGAFRKTLLDLDTLRYAVLGDEGLQRLYKSIVVTCMDLVGPKYEAVENGVVIDCGSKEGFLRRIKEATYADKVYVSNGPRSSDIEEWEF
jgi:adenylosuccinate synthase